MKRVIGFPCVLLLIAASLPAYGQVEDTSELPGSQESGIAHAAALLQATTTPDATLSRGGCVEPYYADDRTPEALYRLIEDLAENKAREGNTDTLIFQGFARAGRYDQLNLSKLAAFGGLGPEVSKLLTTAQNDGDAAKPAGPSIELGDGTRVFACELQNVPVTQHEDGSLIGWSVDGQQSAYLQGVRLRGQDWTFYSWGGAGNNRQVVIEDCAVYFARQGISQLTSGAAKSHWIVRRTKFYGDANDSRSIGATSLADPATAPEYANGGVLGAIVFRAGLLEVEDSEVVYLRGRTEPITAKYGVPRIAAVTDHFYSPGSRGTQIVLRNFRVGEVTPGMASIVNDFDMRWGTKDADNSAEVNPAEVVVSEAAATLAEAEQAKSAAAEALAQAQIALKSARGGTNPDGTFKVWEPTVVPGPVPTPDPTPEPVPSPMPEPEPTLPLPEVVAEEVKPD